MDFTEKVQALWADIEAYVEDVALILPEGENVRLITISTPEQPRGAAMATVLHALGSMLPKTYALAVPNGAHSREVVVFDQGQRKNYMLSIINSGVDVPHWTEPSSTPTIDGFVDMVLEQKGNLVLKKVLEIDNLWPGAPAKQDWLNEMVEQWESLTGMASQEAAFFIREDRHTQLIKAEQGVLDLKPLNGLTEGHNWVLAVGIAPKEWAIAAKIGDDLSVRHRKAGQPPRIGGKVKDAKAVKALEALGFKIDPA